MIDNQTQAGCPGFSPAGTHPTCGWLDWHRPHADEWAEVLAELEKGDLTAKVARAEKAYREGRTLTTDEFFEGLT